ncbi:MAG: hypothetical protein F4X98_11020 [Gammaproteobacteria bacterium]|nr:hypothetical protein [Gammaproteobacteria bacterium]
MKCVFGSILAVFAATQVFGAEQVPVIAVWPIESSVRQWDTENMRAAIETQINKTRKFKVMERGRLDTLLEEQGLSVSGITEGDDSLGGFGGVDYLLYGRVTQVALESKSQLLFTQCEATLGLDVRTVDRRTGEIRYSENVRLSKNVASGGADEDPCRGLPLSSVEELSIDAAETVANKLTISLFPVKIANVDGARVFLNYGDPVLTKGDYVRVVKLGSGFVDPDTGEVLGAEEVEAGVLLVTEVRAKYSIADVLLVREEFGVGDVGHKVSGKDAVKAVRSELAACDSARRNEQRRCRKAGPRCDEAREARIRACGV